MRREPKLNRSRRMTLLSGVRRATTHAAAKRIDPIGNPLVPEGWAVFPNAAVLNVLRSDSDRVARRRSDIEAVVFSSTATPHIDQSVAVEDPHRARSPLPRPIEGAA